MPSVEKFGVFQVKRERKDRTKEKASVKEHGMVKEEQREIYGGLRGERAMKIYWRGPVDYAKALKL